jgi:hypothetical protein
VFAFSTVTTAQVVLPLNSRAGEMLDEALALADVVILDGCSESDDSTKTILARCVTWHLKNVARPFVLLSASRFEPVKENSQIEIRKHHVISWSEEEYYQACQDHRFLEETLPFLLSEDEETKQQQQNRLKSSDKEERDAMLRSLIAEKFYLAGGSCRYFRSMTHTKAREVIDVNLQRLGDIDSFVRFTAGALSKAAESHLYTRFGRNIGDLTLLSKYVSQRLSRKLKVQHIQAVRSVAMTKAPLLGWLEELEVSTHLRNSSKFSVTDTKTNLQETWFFPACIDACLYPFPYEEKYWPILLPDKFNNECWDLAQLVEDGDRFILRAVKITRQTKGPKPIRLLVLTQLLTNCMLVDPRITEKNLVLDFVTLFPSTLSKIPTCFDYYDSLIQPFKFEPRYCKYEKVSECFSSSPSFLLVR